MSYPRQVPVNVPAAAYANLPTLAMTTPPASTESGVDCGRSGLSSHNNVRALAAPRVANLRHHHGPAPATVVHPATAPGDVPSPVRSTVTRDIFSFDRGKQPQGPVIAAVLPDPGEPPSPTSSEVFKNLFGDEDEGMEGSKTPVATTLHNASATQLGHVSPITVIPSHHHASRPSNIPYIYPTIALQSSWPTSAVPKAPPVLSSKAAGKRRAVDVPASLAGSPTLDSEDPHSPPHDDNLECNHLLQEEARNIRTAIANSLQDSLVTLPYLHSPAGPVASSSSMHPPPVHPRPYTPSTVVPTPIYEDEGYNEGQSFTSAAELQGSNKRKRGDDDIGGQIDPMVQASHSCANPFDDLEKYQSTCTQNPQRPTLPHDHSSLVHSASDPGSHQNVINQGKQVPLNNTPNAMPATPHVHGNPSLIGFSEEELEHWLTATENHYGCHLDDNEKLYMCLRPHLVTTSELVSAFSNYQWPGPEAIHIYLGYKQFPVPPNLPCTTHNLGIRVGVFENPYSLELRFIPLDIEGSTYTTLEELFSSLIGKSGGTYIHHLHVVDVTAPSFIPPRACLTR